MHCSNCGTNNKKEALFCEECGNKLKEKKKKLQKKSRKIIGISIMTIIFLGFGFSLLSYQSSPKKVAQRYMEALITGNVDKLYQYLKIDGDKTFITKEVYQDLLENSKPSNYHVKDVEYGNGNLTASVIFTYIENDQEKTKRLSLVKQKKKWLFFFDNWKISSSETNDKIVENFKIIVPKGSKVTYAGIEVKNQYLDKNSSTETTDIYILKQVFRASTKIVVELENGYKIEDEMTPSIYKNTYTANISLGDISKEEQNKIEALIKNDITILYEGVIHNKSFETLENINIEKNNTERVEKKYNALKENLMKSYNILTAIEFTNITLSSVKLDEDGNLEFRFKANYQYTIEYLDSASQKQSKSRESYTYMNFSYHVKNNTYYIVDANNLEDYFSRY